MLPTKLIAKTNRRTEHEEQTRLILFVTNYLMHEYPILRWLHAIPNGLSFESVDARTRGKITTQMIREGVKSGVCDLFLPVKGQDYRGHTYSGLYIEMKSATGSLSLNQKEFIAFVESQGYKVVVPRSADEALAEIVAYCGLPSNIKIIDELVAA